MALAALLLALTGMAPLARADSLPPAGAPNHIAAELVSEGPAPGGRTATLAIHFRPAPGWHGYWLNPGDAGFAMHLAWQLPVGATLGEPAYPVPQTLVVAGLMNHVYERDYAVLVPLTMPADWHGQGNSAVILDAAWLACSATICVPEKARLETVVPVPGFGDPRFDGWRAALPAPLGGEGAMAAHFAVEGKALRLAIPLPARVKLNDPHLFVAADGVADYAAPQRFARAGDMLVVTLARGHGGGAAPKRLPALLSLGGGAGLSFTAMAGPVPSGGEPVGGAGASPGLGWLMLAALAGGLILNLMPCVFPILSIKALALARAGGSGHAARTEGLAYTAGVVLACTALGGLLLGLRAGGAELGWAFQLQQPLVVAGLLLLAVAITANFAGLFEFAVPGFVGNAAGEARGAFATGLLAAFVATPCTGPFMASAMGAALLLPPLPALLIFAALGLGLALPFLALALFPALRRMLPRPGAWMGRFRRAMAVPMALTALALVWLASRLAGDLFALLLLGFAVGVLGALVAVGGAQRRGTSARLPLASALVVAVAALIALPRAERTPDAAGNEILAATPYSDAALARALASGHPVFAFFTADWCLTCKVNERSSIETTATRDAFARAGVVVIEGDWTRRDASITRYLTAHGAAGVPLYVWYPANSAKGGGAPQVLPQVLTPALLAGLPGRAGQ